MLGVNRAEDVAALLSLVAGQMEGVRGANRPPIDFDDAGVGFEANADIVQFLLHLVVLHDSGDAVERLCPADHRCDITNVAGDRRPQRRVHPRRVRRTGCRARSIW